jgi:hypothetical protein
MKRIKRILIFGAFAIAIYVAAYGILYYNRKPAGDLAYWDYTSEEPRNGLWGEDCLYYGFYPVYIIHQRLFHCQRHIFDFYFAQIPDDFQG